MNGIVRQAWEQHVLLNLTLELTYLCQLACRFCYNDRRRRGAPLTEDQYARLLQEARSLGCLYLTLTGGEPTRSPYFLGVGRRARQLGFCIRIKTHGSYRDSSLIERIKRELDPFMLDVSIHGSRPETHDTLTCVEGSFQRLWGNLQEMRRQGLRVTLRCPVTNLNENEIESIAELGDRLGFPVRFDPDIFPRDDGDRSPLKLAPSREGVLRMYQFLASSSPSGPGFPDEDAQTEPEVRGYNCGAGTGALTVDPYGEVLPCVAWRVPLGNLGKSSLREIWEASVELSEIRAENRRAGQSFGSGELTAGLPFCPGRAYQETGRASRLSAPLVQLSGLFQSAQESTR